jgi:hypothetical protein
MARALRIERPGGRCHVAARGNERKHIFREDAGHFHFLELLSELGERFGARVRAYVLMDSRYHLLLGFVSRVCRLQAAPGLGVAGAVGSFVRWIIPAAADRTSRLTRASRQPKPVRVRPGCPPAPA